MYLSVVASRAVFVQYPPRGQNVMYTYKTTLHSMTKYLPWKYARFNSCLFFDLQSGQGGKQVKIGLGSGD